MFQLSLHHDLWTIELPVKRENCSCRGRDNKVGIITGNVGRGKARVDRGKALDMLQDLQGLTGLNAVNL